MPFLSEQEAIESFNKQTIKEMREMFLCDDYDDSRLLSFKKRIFSGEISKVVIFGNKKMTPLECLEINNFFTRMLSCTVQLQLPSRELSGDELINVLQRAERKNIFCFVSLQNKDFDELLSKADANHLDFYYFINNGNIVKYEHNCIHKKAKESVDKLINANTPLQGEVK